MCLRHPSISYHLYFIYCNKIASKIFRRGCHRNLILAYFEELVTILILEMNHMDEFFLFIFLLFFLHFISWFIYDNSQRWKFKHILRKNKINGHDIKDEHMFTLVILKRHVIRFSWLTSHHVFWKMIKIIKFDSIRMWRSGSVVVYKQIYLSVGF